MDSLSAYDRLAQLLTNDVPISIEIIPGSQEQYSDSVVDNPHYPFLLINGNLGIPQSVLYKSYVLAVKQLSRFRIPKGTPERGRDNEYTGLVSSTAIVLVANPGHNTALNRRKQLIQLNSSLITPRNELSFTAALLGIKHTSKSSLLWHHRRWLLRRVHGGSVSPASLHDDLDSLNGMPIPCDALAAEFQLATRAGEIYPRNYHAWLHRYICVQCLISRVPENVEGSLDVLHTEWRDAQRWIELHVSDHTAVHYMSRLVAALEDSNIQIPLPSSSYHSLASITLLGGAAEDHDRPTLYHALSLVSSYPAHESLWLYLRLGATSNNQSLNGIRWITDCTLSFCEEPPGGEECAVPSPTEILVRKILASARAEEIPKIQKHALRMFIWTQLSTGKLYLDKALVQRVLLDSEPPTPIYLRGLCTT